MRLPPGAKWYPVASLAILIFLRVFIRYTPNHQLTVSAQIAAVILGPYYLIAIGFVIERISGVIAAIWRMFR